MNVDTLFLKSFHFDGEKIEPSCILMPYEDIVRCPYCGSELSARIKESGIEYNCESNCEGFSVEQTMREKYKKSYRETQEKIEKLKKDLTELKDSLIKYEHDNAIKTVASLYLSKKEDFDKVQKELEESLIALLKNSEVKNCQEK